MKDKNKPVGNIMLILGILILLLMEYLVHHNCTFMMDDLWYSTNLSTGHPLQTLGDVWESQVWHFYNWGGRNITHGILQLTLMGGELLANIINIIMMVLLVVMCCLLSRRSEKISFLLAASLIIVCNPNIQESIFWQSGTVNYVYSTAWIFIFLWLYLRETFPEKSGKIPLITFWIIPLALITGWSNENMGPASFVISGLIIIYIWKYLHRKPPIWMFLGSAFSLLGSILVIMAPGNFVRSSHLPDTDFLTMAGERLLNMLCAGTDYLFPAIALFLLFLYAYVAIFKNKLKPFQWFLLLHAILSYGAMVLSPHYPDRATFGTMCVFIVLIVSMFGEIIKSPGISKKYIYFFTVCTWFYAMFKLTLYIF